MTKYRFGKHPPRKDYRTLLMRNYTSSLPAPADNYNVLDAIYQNLGTNDPTALFPMDGNDTYGDCGVAGIAHGFQAAAADTGETESWPTDSQVVSFYLKYTGGQDSGRHPE